jgi:TolA-binding protein
MENCMRNMAVLISCICLAALLACSGKGAEAEELFQTAQLEELQKNHDHACQLYQEIIKHYPKHAYAEKAKKRLAALK